MDNKNELRHAVHKDNLQACIEEAYEEKKGIYSVEPEGPPDQIKDEVKRAKVKFANVVEEEKERIKLVADKEDRRVMKLLRENEEDVACPLCLEDLPAINNPQNPIMMMHCCGVRFCRECSEEWAARHKFNKEMICFSCRGPVNTGSSEGGMVLKGNGFHKGNTLLHMSLDLHRKGKFQESLDCIRKAADLGVSNAYYKLAVIYYSGDYDGFKCKKSLEKAKEMAQKGSDKGNPYCNYLLAEIKNEEGDHSEYVRLISIAAYQGSAGGMCLLSNHYIREAIGEALQSEKDLLLGLYWTGKTLENRFRDDDKAFQDYTVTFINLMEDAMKEFWHKRSSFDIEPLTGCSHIPFCNWFRRQVRKMKSMTDDDVLYHTKGNAHSVWMEICANCGNRNKEKLKLCARCKSFAYCSKECQVKHWKAGHKVDCKGHWIEEFFPNIRNKKYVLVRG